MGEQLDGVIVSQADPLPDGLRQAAYELESYSCTTRELQEVLLKKTDIMRKQHAADRHDFAIRGLKAVIPKKVVTFAAIAESASDLEAKRQQQQSAKDIQAEQGEAIELETGSTLTDDMAARTARARAKAPPRVRVACDLGLGQGGSTKKKAKVQNQVVKNAATPLLLLGAGGSVGGAASAAPSVAGGSVADVGSEEFDVPKILGGWNCNRQLSRACFSAAACV